jgi:hypothetical protein
MFTRPLRVLVILLLLPLEIHVFFAINNSRFPRICVIIHYINSVLTVPFGVPAFLCLLPFCAICCLVPSAILCVCRFVPSAVLCVCPFVRLLLCFMLFCVSAVLCVCRFVICRFECKSSFRHSTGSVQNP